MQITHEHARKLIHLSLDRGLQSAEQRTLSTHLHTCSECEMYATGIHEVDALLRPVLKRRWHAQPVPLSITTLIGDKGRRQASPFLTIRSAVITLMFFAVFFSMWQFMSSDPSELSYTPIIVPSLPTPSAQAAQSTSTQATLETCGMMLYDVQGIDTLPAIAAHFRVSEGQLMELNHLTSKEVKPSMKLAIPVCSFAPTGTFYLATYTTTYTPKFLPTTSTPGG